MLTRLLIGACRISYVIGVSYATQVASRACAIVGGSSLK
jgi:hypothetical protein